MPADAREQVRKLPSGKWQLRYYDKDGNRHSGGSHPTQSAARRHYREVVAPKLAGTVSIEPITLSELVDEFLAQHVAEANTIQALRDRLKLATDGIPVRPRAVEREHGLGSIRVDRLDVRSISAWRRRLPEGSAWHAHKALRQVLAYAVRCKMITENVAQLVTNPEPKRTEVPVFGSWDDITNLANELPPERRSLPILVVGTGLRPEEWLALERRDLDLNAGVLHVRRVFTDGRVKDYGKQQRSLRRIPLRRRVLQALAEHPWRIDTQLVYPGSRGNHLDLHNWRRTEWASALEAAGLPHRIPYSMRHTFASFAIAAGVSLFYLARLLGSSIAQVDKTYGHMLPDSEEYLRGLFDAFDGFDETAEPSVWGTSGA